MLKNLHLIVNENRKKQYMNNKKYKYVDAVWKFIESYDPARIMQKNIKNIYLIMLMIMNI